jgi:hypothetical protein
VAKTIRDNYSIYSLIIILNLIIVASVKWTLQNVKREPLTKFLPFDDNFDHFLLIKIFTSFLPKYIFNGFTTLKNHNHQHFHLEETISTFFKQCKKK